MHYHIKGMFSGCVKVREEGIGALCEKGVG